jgi:hypothetical protein
LARRIIGWPEVVFASDWRAATLTNATKTGRLHRIAHGVYTPSDEPGEIVLRRNWVQVLEHAFPGAVLVDASARTGSPDSGGRLFVDHARRSPLALPGLSIIPRHGPGPLPGDQPLQGFFLSSPARGMLDNLAGRGSRYLSEAQIQAWVTDLVVRHGESYLNQVRDGARSLSGRGASPAAFERLSAIISAALSTGDADEAMLPALRSSAAGQPYDHHRVSLFSACAAYLGDQAPTIIPDPVEMAGRRSLLPFYEAYFSNYIEGTEFTLEEAARIVFDAEVPADRPEDAHDILGTYRLVADEAEMRRTPGTADELVEILLARHGVIMEQRPGRGPGRFKAAANRAGATVFVEPRLSEGTLRAGFAIAGSLDDAFARAVYMMLLVSEVHPFADGNGRVARVMMNAELVTAGQVRAIIPTVFRGEYLGSLKNATNNGAFDGIASVLRFAQRYTAQVDFSSRASADHDLARTNALVESPVAETNNIRLRLPSALDRIGGS